MLSQDASSWLFPSHTNPLIRTKSPPPDYERAIFEEQTRNRGFINSDHQKGQVLVKTEERVEGLLWYRKGNSQMQPSYWTLSDKHLLSCPMASLQLSVHCELLRKRRSFAIRNRRLFWYFDGDHSEHWIRAIAFSLCIINTQAKGDKVEMVEVKGRREVCSYCSNTNPCVFVPLYAALVCTECSAIFIPITRTFCNEAPREYLELLDQLALPTESKTEHSEFVDLSKLALREAQMFLCQSGLDPNRRHPQTGQTNLHTCIRSRFLHHVVLLLCAGADPEIVFEGETALELAIRLKLGDIAKLLTFEWCARHARL